MRIGSLFSGVGGLDLAALELFADSSMAWHSEIDPAASKVLAHHWPGVPNLGDVSEIDWAAVEPVDIITGGFPCQDISLAGARRGLGEGTRSGLWAHMATAIDVLRPRYVLVENVRGLLSAEAFRAVESGPDGVGDGGVRPVLRALGAVLADLAALGFDAEWTSVRASDMGACHRRERVFILAYPADTDRDTVRQQPESEPRRRDAAVVGRGGAHVADSDGTGLEGPQSAGRRYLPAGSDFGPVVLLPTPQVADATGGHMTRSGARSNEVLLPGLARAYADGALLPTPRASDGAKGGPNQRGSSGDLMLPSAVMSLLSPPRTTDANGPGVHEAGGLDLRTAVAQWGEYEPAIRCQEMLSRPAPSPTEPNSRGNQRLSARFAEWMMWWPDGWVTDPAIGLSRNDQLKCIGNGVVPSQAVAAFRWLFGCIGMVGGAS